MELHLLHFAQQVHVCIRWAEIQISGFTPQITLFSPYWVNHNISASARAARTKFWELNQRLLLLFRVCYILLWCMLLKVYSGRLADGVLAASVIWTFPDSLAESSPPLRTRPQTGYPLPHPDMECKLGPKFGIRQQRCIFTSADHYCSWRHHRSL